MLLLLPSQKVGLLPIASLNKPRDFANKRNESTLDLAECQDFSAPTTVLHPPPPPPTNPPQKDPTSKSLVFSQFNSSLAWLMEALPKRGFGFRTLTGNMSRKQRTDALQVIGARPPAQACVEPTPNGGKHARSTHQQQCRGRPTRSDLAEKLLLFHAPTRQSWRHLTDILLVVSEKDARTRSASPPSVLWHRNSVSIHVVG